MEEWNIVEIKDICTGIYEGPHATPKESLTGGIYLGIPAISSDGHINFDNAKRISEEDLPVWTKRVTPQEDDIVFTNEATLNLYAIIPSGFHGCLGRRLGLIRPNKNLVDVRYLFYYFFSPEWREIVSRNKVSGATVERILMKKFPHFPVKLPPLSVQKRIADILSSIDEKIALNNRINHNLEEQAQVLYRSWFVDFEPFKDGGFVDSEMGPIPNGWRIGRINDIINIQSGFAFKSESFEKEGTYKLITIKAVQDGFLTLSGADSINDPLPQRMPAYCVLSNGDILLSLTGNVGRVCLVDREQLLLNQRVAKLHPIFERDRAYSYFVARSADFKNSLLQLARGTAQMNLSPVETGLLNIPIAPGEVMAQFSKIATPIFNTLLSNLRESFVLKGTRDQLLPELLTGRFTC